MSYNPIRCDQCIKLHGLCDRTLPSCQVCIDRKVECTYLTKSKNRKWLDQLKGGLIRFKQQKEVKATKKRTQKETQYIVTKAKLEEFGENPNEFKITKLPNGYDWESTPLGIMNRFPKKMVLENLMTLVQYPSPYQLSNGLSLFLTLTDKLKILVQKPKPTHSNITQRPKVLPLNKLLNEAIRNYFIYMNSVFPLFIEDGFDFFSKPLILRLAIMAVGLLWCKKDESVCYLINYFSDRIWERMSYPHNLKPSLETIQSILIIIIGFRNTPRTLQLANEFVSYCNRFSMALGLNLPYKYFKGKRALERSLTCSCLNYVIQYSNLITAIYTHSPTRIHALSKKYNKLLSETHLSNELFVDLDTSPKIVLGSFHCDISLAFFSLRMLKSRFVYPDSPLKDLERALIPMLKKIGQIEIHYFKACTQLYALFKHQIFVDQSKYILVTCNYLKYFLYSLYLYHPDFTINQDDLQSKQKFRDIVNKALEACQIVIKASTTLPSQYMISMGIANLSQCIVFMIRYKTYSGLALNTIINMGKECLKRSSQYMSLNFLSSYNLYLIGIIEANIPPK